MHRSLIQRGLQALAACLCSGIAAAHPLDPLTADEIIGAAQHPAGRRRGAAGRDLPERRAARAAEGRGARAGGAPLPRRATVFFRQNKQSFKSTVNLSDGTFTRPAAHPASATASSA